MDTTHDGTELQQTTSTKIQDVKSIQQTIRKHIIHQYKAEFTLHNLRGKLTRATPLFAALVAPVSTLYDIPALCERWYTLNGVVQHDPKPNLALSALGLAFNAIANGLLILRFSANRKWWKAAMISSTVCWIIKTVIAVVNLCLYGTSFRNSQGYQYTSAFWCGVVSCVLAGVIASTLVLYIIAAGDDSNGDKEEVRVQGRQFMLGELGLFFTLALEALIFSRIEGWGYFDGIYFSLVVSLTIGYGDYVPTHTSTKVLLFPFAIITVAFLASQVSMIVQYFGQHAKERRQQWRQLYEDQRQQDYSEDSELHKELIDEIEFLRRLVKQEESLSRLTDLALSLGGFIAFWVLGAIVYHAIEGWSWGNAMYFCYVTFFTIGFGDFSPTTPAGKVYFVIYALIAVPLIASFAVQTVTSLWTAFQEHRLEKEKERRGLEPNLDRETTLTMTIREQEVEIHPFISHSELVAKCHEYNAKSDQQLRSLGKLAQESEQKTDGKAKQVEVADTVNTDDAEISAESRHQKEIVILDELLAQVVEMESRARKLLINEYEHGSKPRLLLQADKNLMDRAQNVLVPQNHQGGDLQTMLPADNLSVLEEIHLYRLAFARFLVCGTRLKRLQGAEQLYFERRRGDPYLDGKAVQMKQ